MKNIIIVLCTFLLFSCKTKPSDSKKEVEISIENKKDYIDIIGVFERKELNNEPHLSWFQENYNDYSLDEPTAEKIKPLIKDIDITVFMGTWCSDSRRDSPAFFKLIDFLKIKDQKLELRKSRIWRKSLRSLGICTNPHHTQPPHGVTPHVESPPPIC